MSGIQIYGMQNAKWLKCIEILSLIALSYAGNNLALSGGK